ncbi:MAG: UDP-N-acetylglucosamine 2-epimerase (non-hydrolyzing) [Candidatus Omnitrophica bacterium]|nr:UDP-N-acetylglucosamine 2-epimerase (non-hydrolyzing) [bacterium]MBV6482275.1 UDP-N-acetylglucosamine 2-epimerase [bacterium]MCE7909544.1 UDP-N-acetylglucosamine 2-epimerase (non-hydrolyzing) [Candidatus Omnitrophica bacterium COP1]MCL4735942.1 UDP-N-acetylglucosamine 2-epimerase (non-hydrolyzing) [Candidatus Omnitrophota bacterium]
MSCENPPTKKKVRVLSVFGTRPEAIKMAPVVRTLRTTSGIESRVCVTAQHREMLDQVLEAFEITPDYDLDLMRSGQGLFDLTARVLTGMDPVLSDVQPDLVLVHGDTTTTFAVSLAAFYQRIAVGHVEAGLRTRNKYAPFPEEMNRQLTSRLTDLHFAPTPASRANLLMDAIPAEQVFVVGNTAIDALLWMKAKLDHVPSILSPWLPDLDESTRLVLITAHRRESFGEGFEAICLALKDLAGKFRDTRFVYPVHLNPNVQDPVRYHLSEIPNISLIEPLPYAPFVALMQRATIILTDSGGVQEEAPSLGKPVLVLREITERPEAVSAGTVLLVGPDRQRIVAEASILLEDSRAYSKMSRTLNPYGDGLAAERIVDVILESHGLSPCFRHPPFTGS